MYYLQRQWSYAGLPDFPYYSIPKREKIPHGLKIDQTAVKYTNIIHCKTVQSLPKLGFLVREYTRYLATLVL
jgi:hypothetical protein